MLQLQTQSAEAMRQLAGVQPQLAAAQAQLTKAVTAVTEGAATLQQQLESERAAAARERQRLEEEQKAAMATAEQRGITADAAKRRAEAAQLRAEGLQRRAEKEASALRAELTHLKAQVQLAGQNLPRCSNTRSALFVLCQGIWQAHTVALSRETSPVCVSISFGGLPRQAASGCMQHAVALPLPGAHVTTPVCICLRADGEAGSRHCTGNAGLSKCWLWDAAAAVATPRRPLMSLSRRQRPFKVP